MIADLNDRGREVVQAAIASLTGKIHEVNVSKLNEVEQLLQPLGTMQLYKLEFVSMFVVTK